MSYTIHHAIVVTAAYDASLSLGDNVPAGVHWAEYARQKALEIFGAGQVSEVVDTRLNNVRSFFVGPDGSSENRDESDEGDAARERYIAWLRDQSYGINEDGEYEGSPLAWVVVRYGDEQGEAPELLADSNEDQA